jgi:Family of unknown function (DUF6496)
MPETRASSLARRDRLEGKSPSTQAGEFVREEIRRIRQGKHGARSTSQAIAIGLSQARRAGVKLPPPAAGQASPRVRRKAQKDLAAGKNKAAHPISTARSRATLRALRRENRAAASSRALAQQARRSARRKSAARRSAIARRAAQTRNRLRTGR